MHRVSGHFIDGAKGSIFVLLRQPAQVAAGCVLVVPAFAEEMNKCRRMVTEVAMGLERQGIATLVPDLYGTGDSQGEYSDADWIAWQGDIANVAAWSAGQGLGVSGLLAIRLGAALAAGCVVSDALPAVSRTVLWQPVFDGSRFLTQFLRLRTAASLMGAHKETLPDLRERLKAEGVLTVAGYDLSDRLCRQLEALLTPGSLPKGLGAVAWLELVRGPDVDLPLPSSRLIEASIADGLAVEGISCPGEPFWSSTEVVVNPEMVARTVAHFSQAGERAVSRAMEVNALQARER